MPLTELMNYFNDQLQVQAKIKSLPRTGFYKAESSYWARFGNLTLGSRFHAITTLIDERIVGYDSELLVRSAAGNLLDIDSIFNSLDSIDQITHLDRLVRTLHSLNYLQQFDGGSELLSLHVQPRHIISVNDDHGKAFENILSDCGLGAERVLLHTRLIDESTLAHFYKALSSYKSRGYKIGILLTQVHELGYLEKLALEPDVIYFQYPALQGVVKPRAPVTALTQPQFSGAKRILISSNSIFNESLEKMFDGVLLKNNISFNVDEYNSDNLRSYPFN